MLSYIYDYLSILLEKIKEKERIKNIILFGSFARGNYTKDSDIELFINVDEESITSLGSLAKEALNEFELKSEKTWKLKGIEHPINQIVDDIDKEKWSELKREISSYGITLYGRETSLSKEDSIKIKKLVLIEYDISKLKQKDKMNVLRNLLGYKQTKSKKVYAHKGIIEKLKAEKISNAILVDLADYKEIYKFLRQNNVSIKIRDFNKVQ